MKSINQYAFALLACMLILNCCTVEKRVYRPGFSGGWNTSVKNPAGCESACNSLTDRVSPDQKRMILRSVNALNTLEKLPELIDESLTASSDNSMLQIKTASYLHNTLSARPSLDECDKIILSNGEEIDAKILEVTVAEIKYKKCDFLDGPTYTIDKSGVNMIKYPNGSKDVFTPDYYTTNHA